MIYRTKGFNGCLHQQQLKLNQCRCLGEALTAQHCRGLLQKRLQIEYFNIILGRTWLGMYVLKLGLQ